MTKIVKMSKEDKKAIKKEALIAKQIRNVIIGKI